MNVYDFDNTIYDGDSTLDFYLFCLKRHKNIIRFFPVLVKAFAKYYVFKRGTKTQFKENMYSFLTAIDASEDIEDFWNTHFCKVKDWYKERQREDDVIISASPRFLLEPVCQRLGNKNLIASEVAVKTGKYTGINCHGEEKVRRFREQLSEEIDLFYSDSHSDDPMAKISKRAFMVKGCKATPWRFK